MIYCIMYPNEPATVEVTYGMFEGTKETCKLCDKAAKELWDKYATLVNLGMMHWGNKPIKQLE